MSTSTATESVLLEVADGVATITLNRPQVRNAIDRPTAERLAETLDEVDSRPDIRAAILTGAAGFFSAGMDLKAFSATGERPLTESRGAFGIVERPTDATLIAAVEGPALGGGFEIALACDMIVAGESARFGLPEVQRGLVAAAGGLLRLSERLPRNIALELILTGESIDASRAHSLGLVNRISPQGESSVVARELAARIAANAPLAVATSKQVVTDAPGWPAEARFARQAPLAQRVRESADAREGALAFTEKRAPQWTGS